MKMTNRSSVLRKLILVPVCSLALASVAEAQHYKQTNLVSDLPGMAAITDPNLANPWGLSRSSGSPWWVSDNVTGVSTLYDGKGNPQGLVVTIPPGVAGQTGSPTGTVFNGTNDFQLTPGNPAAFLFVTEDGTVAGWNPAVNPTQAIQMVNQTPGSVFKGAALAVHNGANLLYATDFRVGKVAVFDTNFQPVSFGNNAFKDSRIPSGFAPYNIQNIGGNLYVTFGKQNALKHDSVSGPGLGFVDVFAPNGMLLQRFEHGEWLNAPWGLVLTSGDFGTFSHRLLVGQFGSGAIVSYDTVTGKFLGNVRDTHDAVLKIDGLWALSFGDEPGAGSPVTLYFSAGIQGETHGLFGTLRPVGSELTQGNGN
jgi:uncharacterized protein (TIGR03118 family)